MSDDFRQAWLAAVELYQAEKEEAKRLREEIMRLVDENRKLRAEVNRASYHCD